MDPVDECARLKAEILRLQDRLEVLRPVEPRGRLQRRVSPHIRRRNLFRA